MRSDRQGAREDYSAAGNQPTGPGKFNQFVELQSGVGPGNQNTDVFFDAGQPGNVAWTLANLSESAAVFGAQNGDFAVLADNILQWLWRKAVGIITPLDIAVSAVGKGVRLKGGANGRVGSGVALAAGSATVANTSVTATDLVLVVDQGGGVVGNIGSLREDVASRVPGTSFTVKSTNALDTSTFGYILIGVD